MSLRDYSHLLAIILSIFVAGCTGHWDSFCYMLDGAILMLLYLKGKEK